MGFTRICGFILLTFIFILISAGKCDIFTSMAHLEHAVFAEGQLAQVIERYVETEQRRLTELKRIAEDMKSHSTKALANPELYLYNPNDAFLFIKKHTFDWDNSVRELIKNNTHVQLEEFRRQVKYCRKSLPRPKDLVGAAAAIVRLQDIYQLNTADIAQGKLRGANFTKLTATDCFEIGKLRFFANDFNHSSLWMSHTLGELNKDNGKQSVDKAEVLYYLSMSAQRTGQTESALNYTEEILLLDPENEKAAMDKKMYQNLTMKGNADTMEPDDHQLTHGYSDNDFDLGENYLSQTEQSNHLALCRGENIMELPNKHKLRCRYRTRNHPLLILSPAKEEELYLNPLIVMYHDIISDTEIETIKEMATPMLRRAAVRSSDEELEYTQSSVRISKTAWLDDNHSPVIGRLTARIGATTGLNMDTAESFQVGNYGIGGHYAPHTDYLPQEDLDDLGAGNRIATFMFYLSNIEAGATVFPLIGVKIFPVKGAAAFWYNLHRNGEGFYETLHAGCPVLFGTKWVANKWIDMTGQEFRRPCGLRQED